MNNRWQYKVVDAEGDSGSHAPMWKAMSGDDATDNERQLNRLGAEGWELVSVRVTAGLRARFFLKRSA